MESKGLNLFGRIFQLQGQCCCCFVGIVYYLSSELPFSFSLSIPPLHVQLKNIEVNFHEIKPKCFKFIAHTLDHGRTSIWSTKYLVNRILHKKLGLVMSEAGLIIKNYRFLFQTGLGFKSELLHFIVSLEYYSDTSSDLHKLSLLYHSLLSYGVFINMQTSLIRLSSMIAHQFGIERAATHLIKISGGGIVFGIPNLKAYFS